MCFHSQIQVEESLLIRVFRHKKQDGLINDSEWTEKDGLERSFVLLLDGGKLEHLQVDRGFAVGKFSTGTWQKFTSKDKVIYVNPIILVTFSELKRKTRLIVWYPLT